MAGRRTFPKTPPPHMASRRPMNIKNGIQNTHKLHRYTINIFMMLPSQVKLDTIILLPRPCARQVMTSCNNLSRTSYPG